MRLISNSCFYTFLALSLFGCAREPDLYYWGNYSDSLYECKKHPGDTSRAAHIEMLERLIEESKTRNLRIPPGVCAELGYLYAAGNDTHKAVELFNKEKESYPESTVFMNRLIAHIETRRQGDGPDTRTLTDADDGKDGTTTEVNNDPL